MGLKVNVESDSGAVAEYAKVIEVNLNFYANVGSVAVALYHTKAARNNGKRPLDARQFPLQGEAFAQFMPDVLDGAGKNPVRAAYEFIKNYVPAEGQPPNPFAVATDDV